MLDALNEAVPFAKHLRIAITEMAPTGARAVLPNDDFLTNHIGTQHAGALFTLAESASGAALVAACVDLLAIAQPVVRNAHIEYRRAARGVIVARARLSEPADDVREAFARDGRADLEVTVLLIDEDEAEVATASFEWSFRSPKAAALAA